MAMKRTDVQQGADFPVEETAIDEVTFETASRKQNHSLLEKDHARKALVNVYKAEPKISVMVAPVKECT